MSNSRSSMRTMPLLSGFWLIGMVLLASRVTGQHLTWPDPVANHVVPRQSTPVTHGPVLGDITASSVRIWIRADRRTPFEVLISPDRPPFEGASVTSANTNADQDFTGFAEVRGLRPNSVYAYAVRVNGMILDSRERLSDPWPTFRTLPDETSFAHEFNPRGEFNFSFSIGACQRQSSGDGQFGIYPNPPAFDTLWEKHRQRLAFHIVNGDYTYEETLDGAATGIQNNYKLYLSRGRSLNRLLQHVPLFTIYNDHEVTDNIDGSGEVGLGDGNYLVRDPAIRVWQYYADWANGKAPHKRAVHFGTAELKEGSNILYDPDAHFDDLDLKQVSTLHIGPFFKANGTGARSTRPSPAERGGRNIGVYDVRQIIDDTHLRIDRPLKQTNTAPYSIGTHHYFDRVIGNCHFFFLDTRGERSEFNGVSRAHDADRFVLGAAQKKWFVEKVKATDAAFIFVVSPDPWFIYHSAYHVLGRSTESKGDGYCGYVHEREELTAVLDRIEKPVLLFTGDVHHPVAAQITDNVWEFLVSPVNSANHPLGTAGLPPLGGWFDSEGRTIKIKWLGGYPDNVHYLRQRHTVYSVVHVNNIVKAGRKVGPGYQFLAYDEPQVVVCFHDGYTGDLLYSEGISTLDARPPGEPAEKKNRFGHWNR